MKTLIKLSLASIFLISFSACEEVKKQKTEGTHVDINMGVNIYCDIDKNVEYMIFKGYKSGGMTPRYNQDGTLSACIKEK